MAVANTELLSIALAGAWPAALVSGVALGIAFRPWKRRDPVQPTDRRAAWAPPIAIALGYVAGHIGLHGWPPPPPGSGIKDRLVYLALAALFVALVEAFRGRASRIGRVLLSLVAPWYALEFMRRNYWEGTAEVLWLAAGSAITFVLIGGVERIGQRRPTPTWSFVWVVLVTMASGALFFGGSASLSQLASAMATSMGAIGVISFGRGSALTSGATTCLAVLYAALIAAGHFAAELPGTSTVLLLAAPLGAFAGELPAVASRTTLRWALTLLLVLGPAAVALYLAHAAVPPNPYAGY